MHASGSHVAVSLVGLALCAPVPAQSIQRVSVAFDGAQGNGDSGGPFSGSASISSTSRYIVFQSLATNLVPGDTNAVIDVFLRDRASGTTRRLSVDSSGNQANAGSDFASISADGRHVAFRSFASNLVASDANAFAPDIFVHDNLTGETRLVSVSSLGVQGNNASYSPVLSADGRFVAFASIATNLVPGDTNGGADIFVHDCLSGMTERMSTDSGGGQSNGESYNPAISADGRLVAFHSNASNLVPNDTNGNDDVLVHDRQTGSTVRASVQSSGAQSAGGSTPAISADGRYVAFFSGAANLVPGDNNNFGDVFVHDLQIGTTVRVSVDSSGAQANGDSFDPAISMDGHFVAFMSFASNLVSDDTNGSEDVFVHDCWTGSTVRASLDSASAQGLGNSFGPSLSVDGRTIAFYSEAGNLVPGDTNGARDAFVRDCQTEDFVSLCDPGMDGVVTCPCLNLPIDADRGCENFSGTGGASLTAAGSAHLSTDSLVFATSGENPRALSIVMQGNSLIPNGVFYGHGVRCVGGPLIRRLFTKIAIAGCITAPEISAGDPSVSARSAAKGDVIQQGQSRWYLVYYRDPSVLGGCPAGATFNSTQTGRVDWLP